MHLRSLCLSVALMAFDPALAHAEGTDTSTRPTSIPMPAKPARPPLMAVADDRSGPHAAGKQTAGFEDVDDKDDVAPEEMMRRRFPQPVKAGDLIGRPVLSDNRATIGRVRGVVRTPEGKIELLISYGGFLGWGQRLISVPIEVVAAIGTYVAIVDIDTDELDGTETWDGSAGKPVPPDEVIRIAVTAR